MTTTNIYNYENYLHTTAQSEFCSDLQYTGDPIYIKAIGSSIAHGQIKSIDLSLVEKYAGVISVITYKDIPGINDFSGFELDEECLSSGNIEYYGQVIALVAAETEEIATKAAELANITYTTQKPLITIDEAIKENSYLYPSPMHLKRGEPEKELHNYDYYIDGIVESPTQEHWYLETNCAWVSIEEGGNVTIISSTQNPSDVQQVVARVLGYNYSMVSVKVRRIGGGFGGKETWANKPAAWAALTAKKTGRNVFIKLDREQDQTISCKRHQFKTWYKAAFTKNGIIKSLILDSYSNGGHARDLSLSIMERALLHCENSYYIKNLEFTGHCCRTNLLNFGAFRGFGAPQAIFVIENIIERISKICKIDPLEIRKRNYFSSDESKQEHYTFYGQACKCNILDEIHHKFIETFNYNKLKQELNDYNRNNGKLYLKRGMGVCPIKFGISFTNTALNQAGALINIYKDGTIQLSHGGIEMGQGISAKMRKIAAQEFGIDQDKIRIMPSHTDMIPNTSPTAASTGSDLNGMAIQNAAKILKERLGRVALDLFNKKELSSNNLIFFNNKVRLNGSNLEIDFTELIQKAYWLRVPLSTTGYYSSPNIFHNKSTLMGEPFSYFVYGLSLSIVEYNSLTKEQKILKTCILHDVGKSLDEEIDKGQIEGAYIQGVGWLSCEHLNWDTEGKPLNNTPDTYKIPTFIEVPLEFNVELLQDKGNPYAINMSKATGEPPFVYGISAYLAKCAAQLACQNELK